MHNPFDRKPLSPVEQRAQHILDVVLAFAMGDYEHELALTGDDSVFDGLAAGINVLGEELESQTRSLKAQEEYSKSIHKSMGEALLVLNEALHIQTVNPSATSLTGYSEKELLGSHVQSIFSEEAFLALGLEGLLEAGCIEKQETFCVTKRGSKTAITFSASPLRLGSGKLGGLVCVLQDITERKRAESAMREAHRMAEQANAAKSSFLASTSHELRTPLNAIIGYSQLIMEDINDFYEGAVEIVPDVQRIEMAGQYLLALINNILDLSKIEAGKMELHLERFFTKHLMLTVQEISQPLIAKNGNELIIKANNELGEMMADVTKVQQILFNLVSNASKFTKRGEITLEAFREVHGTEEWLVFHVQDTGIGMTKEHQAELFKPFSQGHASIAKEYGGTGLGLAISRRFCEMMGGSISVTSQLDVGTTFTVQLPAVSKASPLITITSHDMTPFPVVSSES